MTTRTWPANHPAQRWPSAHRAWLRLRKLSPLLLVGLAVLLVGGTGDLLYHTLPPDVARQVEPLLGAEAARAHLVTLAGMLLMVAGVIWQGLRS